MCGVFNLYVSVLIRNIKSEIRNKKVADLSYYNYYYTPQLPYFLF